MTNFFFGAFFQKNANPLKVEIHTNNKKKWLTRKIIEHLMLFVVLTFSTI